MNSDGVRLLKPLCLVWFAIALFPREKRYRFQNIVLAAQWFANNKLFMGRDVSNRFFSNTDILKTKK